jgi:hypothetical protein
MDGNHIQYMVISHFVVDTAQGVTALTHTPLALSKAHSHAA